MKTNSNHSNQRQPTPTGVTHWSNKLQQTSLLEFVAVCLCGVNWPIGWMCTHTSNTHLCSTTWKMNFASDDPFKTHSQCLQLTNVTTARGAVPRSQWTASNHRRCYGNLHLLIWNIFTWAIMTQVRYKSLCSVLPVDHKFNSLIFNVSFAKSSPSHPLISQVYFLVIHF